MKTHMLKIWPIYGDWVYTGKKTFEIRLNDRGYSIGDHIIFQVFDPVWGEVEHPLNGIEYEITYILMDVEFSGLQPGYAALAIKPIGEVTK